jgi:predicted RND superfamily exporter protein
MKDNTRMETDLDKYMPQDHPAFIYSDQAAEWFDIKDGIIIAVENPNGIYDTGTLTKIKQLTKDLQKMDEIEKQDVTSLYTADNIVGTEDGMDVKAFYKRIPKTQDKLDELQQKVRSNEMVYGRLVSDNETVTVIIARINDDVFTQEFYNEILELAHSYEGEEKNPCCWSAHCGRNYGGFRSSRYETNGSHCAYSYYCYFVGITSKCEKYNFNHAGCII